MNYSFSYKQDVGLIRAFQEDDGFILNSFQKKLYYSDKNSKSCDDNDLIVICVADGMGGAKNGALASRICIESLKEYLDNFSLDQLLHDIPFHTTEALIYANNKIIANINDNPNNAGMGTTAILGLIYNGLLHVSWVGDSRCYIYKDGQLLLFTKDHSYVQELIDNNIIGEDDEFDHPQKNIITQSLGSFQINPSYKLAEICDDNFILFCSDGLNTMLKFHEIQNVFIDYENLDDIGNKLIEHAKDKGAFDNITICLVKAFDETNNITNTFISKISSEGTEVQKLESKSMESFALNEQSIDKKIFHYINQNKKRNLKYFLISFFLVMIFGGILVYIIPLIDTSFFSGIIKEIDKSDTIETNKEIKDSLNYPIPQIDTFQKLLPDSADSLSDTIYGRFQYNNKTNSDNFGNDVYIDTSCIKLDFKAENYRIRYDVYKNEFNALKEMKKISASTKPYILKVEKLDESNLYGIFIETFHIKEDAENFIENKKMVNAIIVKVIK